MTYTIVQASDTSKVGLRFYGGVRELWRYQGPEAMLEGPYETGKTVGGLTKLHALLCKYPNARGLLLRKTYNSLVNSAVVTYERKVLPFPPGDERCAVFKFGGEKPEFYDYPNGSRLVVAGLDNAGKVLSAEYDYIYVNQAEELSLAEWEIVAGRATGRAGNVPYPQIFGDCNPGPDTHWIIHRDRLKRFKQMHEHNPNLFDQETGEITEQGKRTMATLNAMTGVRLKRGRYGLWVAAEGQVYDNFDPTVHVIDPFPIPASWRRYRTFDFGYTNPFVCQWWATDEDGRLYLYRELYMTRKTVRVHAGLIKEKSTGEVFDRNIADHDAEDRATLHENGIFTVPAKKDISVGIQKVQERLALAGDDRPRIFFFKNALVEADSTLYREVPGDLYPVCTEQEFSSYVWPVGVDGKPNKEVPVDAFNHGMDGVRYMVMELDSGSERSSIGHAPDILVNRRR